MSSDTKNTVYYIYQLSTNPHATVRDYTRTALEKRLKYVKMDPNKPPSHAAIPGVIEDLLNLKENVFSNNVK